MPLTTKNRPMDLLKSLPILFICVPIIVSGCRLPSFTEPEAFGFDLLYVDEVTSPDTSQVNRSLSIIVKGNLPNPSWSFDHFELFEDELSLNITPVGKQNLKVDVIQVLVPFEEEVSFVPGQTGKWKITAVGRNRSVQTEVQIVE